MPYLMLSTQIWFEDERTVQRRLEFCYSRPGGLVPLFWQWWEVGTPKYEAEDDSGRTEVAGEVGWLVGGRKEGKSRRLIRKWPGEVTKEAASRGSRSTTRRC
jgi:hypothetical protein